MLHSLGRDCSFIAYMRILILYIRRMRLSDYRYMQVGMWIEDSYFTTIEGEYLSSKDLPACA